jgi:hypothetical protein
MDSAAEAPVKPKDGEVRALVREIAPELESEVRILARLAKEGPGWLRLLVLQVVCRESVVFSGPPDGDVRSVLCLLVRRGVQAFIAVSCRRLVEGVSGVSVLESR